MRTEYEKVLLPKSVQQELEKLRAQAAEIARLQSGFDELREYCSNWVNTKEDTYFGGYVSAMHGLLKELNRITGVGG